MTSGNDHKVLRVFYEGHIANDGRLRADAEWIAEDSGISIEEAGEAIKALLELGFIKHEMLDRDKYYLDPEKIEEVERVLGDR